MRHLADSLLLDLADPLPRQFELVSNLLQGLLWVTDPVDHQEDVPLAGIQYFHHILQIAAERLPVEGGIRLLRGGVGDDVEQRPVTLIVEGCVEREVAPG